MSNLAMQTADNHSLTMTEQVKVPVVRIAMALETPLKQQFNCTLQTGQIGVLLAPSGAGKTSLFNALTGLIEATGSFKVAADNVEQLSLATYKRNVAYVTQTSVLFNHLNIAELIDLVASQQHRAFDVSWALGPLQLQDKLHLRAAQLSGGQKQRVALVLAMIKGAPLLLLDEALTGQDLVVKQACIAVIRRYLLQNQAAALIACHQLADAVALADVAFVQQSEMGEKSWLAMPISQGVHAYQQQLLDTVNAPMGAELHSAAEYLSVVDGETVSHHEMLGLTEFTVAGQSCYGAYSPHYALKQKVHVMLRADRAGLSKRRLPECSFVNQWSVQILSARTVSCLGEHGMLIDVNLAGEASQQVCLSVWITRLSYNQLQPKIGEYWYLIAKADAFSVTAQPNYLQGNFY